MREYNENLTFKKAIAYWGGDLKTIRRACAYAPAHPDELMEELMADGMSMETALNIVNWCIDTGTNKAAYKNLAARINRITMLSA